VLAIVVHGGISGRRRKRMQRSGVAEAAQEGYEILRRGGQALDAVEKAVVVMEDNPIFNAGTGSALTLDGEAEMDASVMTGDLRCGAVGSIKWVKNPVTVARKVMEETDHVLLAGEGASRFAWMKGFDYYNPVTPERREMFVKEIREEKMNDPYFPGRGSRTSRYGFGTVGAVGLDEKGGLAVATSTGGIMMNLPGRLGDTPLIGAGTYANRLAGASAMGHGECITRLVLAKAVVDRVEGSTVQGAVDRAISDATELGCRCGVIALDRAGNVGIGFNTEGMAYASMGDGQLKVF
jgi:beta-aspartyl-peptidase (threonine type)